MTQRTFIALLLAAAPLAGAAGQQQPAQPATPAPAESALPLATAEQLDLLVAPIALYPDPLIAQLLPASTYPIDVVKAARLVASGGAARIDEQNWDASVKAVARYPEVIKMMDADLEWTQQLGQAFIVQPDDVLAAVQRMRARAIEMGSLADTPQQQVVYEEETVRILPADPQIIYVPVYQPILVYYRRPAYRASFISFTHGYPCGTWLDLDCDWRRRWCYRPGWTWNHWREHLIVRGGRVVSVQRTPAPHHALRPDAQWRRDISKPLTLPGRKLTDPAEFTRARARDHDGRIAIDSPATSIKPAENPAGPRTREAPKPPAPSRAIPLPTPREPRATKPQSPAPAKPAPSPAPAKPRESIEPKPARQPSAAPVQPPRPQPARTYTPPPAPKSPPVTQPAPRPAPAPRPSPPPKPPEPVRDPKKG